MKLSDKKTGKQFFTTHGEDFYAMTHFLNFGFKIKSSKVFGLGERISPEGLFRRKPAAGKVILEVTSVRNDFIEEST